MDPSNSMSDFCLTIIGVSDKDALKQTNNTRKRPIRKRRDKWNVEGLFLDMSASEDDRNDVQQEEDLKQQRQRDAATSRYYLVRKQYHLHKVNLAVGPRSCDYFTHLFQKKQHKEHSEEGTNRHSIEVPMSCLDAIPAMFDYLYDTTNDKVNVTAETAVSLRHLATLFGNRSLFDSATDFIQQDLSSETAITYLLHSDLFRQKKLSNVCINICAQEFHALKIRSLAMLPPYLMERILYSKHFRGDDRYNNAVCAKVAAYCRCQETNIDGRMLLALTDFRVMPEICPEEALFFIKFMIALGMDLKDDSEKDPHNLSNGGRMLYERCVDAASSVVSGVIDSLCHTNGLLPPDIGDSTRMPTVYTRKNKMISADYSQLPSQVKVDLLEYALAKQQRGLGMEECSI